MLSVHTGVPPALDQVCRHQALRAVQVPVLHAVQGRKKQKAENGAKRDWSYEEEGVFSSVSESIFGPVLGPGMWGFVCRLAGEEPPLLIFRPISGSGGTNELTGRRPKRPALWFFPKGEAHRFAVGAASLFSL